MPVPPSLRYQHHLRDARWRQAWIVLLAAAAVLCPEVAQVSMTRIVPVTLDELIEHSSHIVTATPDSPPGVTEDVPVVEGGRTYEPYRRLVSRYRVQASLRGDLKKGAVIEVVSHNDSSLEHMHRLYVTEGTSKSYYDRRYEPQAKVTRGGPLILFVREFTPPGQRYAFVAGQSVEGLAMRDEIERRLKPDKAGASRAAPGSLPEALTFRFNAVQVVKQGNEITLTIFPVWEDAQRGPPGGFDDKAWIYRLGDDDFDRFHGEIALLDFARYARLTDADFETTPPDRRHTEQLYFAENGREVVNWSRSYAWLKNAALRKPLLELEQRLHAWARENPTAEVPEFRRLVLRDVQGLHGGRNVYVSADGTVAVQIVAPTETGLHERRYEFKLNVDQLKDLRTLLGQHPLARDRVPMRPGIPDQARPEITLYRTGGRSITVAKWDNDQSPDFDAIYTRLLGFEKVAQKKNPVREGEYAPDWRPD